jgi:hypothetical protein
VNTDVFESRLRYTVIVAFGILFLLSYAFSLLMIFAFSDPYAQGLANVGLGAIRHIVGSVLPLAVFGILMLLSVFKRGAFHVFFGFALVYKLYMIVVLLTSFQPLLVLGVLDSNSITGMIGAALVPNASVNSLMLNALDLVLWCIPFAVYYLILAIRKRRS